MAKLNLEKLRKHIQAFEFQTVFNGLGWSNPATSKIIHITINAVEFSYSQIAQLSGVVILEIIADSIPDAKTKLVVYEKLVLIHHEQVLIFIDKQRTQSCWFWMKREANKQYPRNHFYFKGQSGELLLSKLAAMNVDFSELDDDGNVAIVEVAKNCARRWILSLLLKSFLRILHKNMRILLSRF
jgi:hypothetical protein